MTLRPEDFVVTWHAEPQTEKPATYSEVIKAMEQINDRARKSVPSTIVDIILRNPVAVAVAKGINSVNPGTAIVDLGQDPVFVPERGGYQSHVLVARTAGHMSAYMAASDADDQQKGTTP